MTKKSLLILKAFALTVVAVMFGFNVFAQSVLVTESFDTNPFPPTGWTTGTTPSNWGRSTNGGFGGALPTAAHSGAAMARFRVRGAGGGGGGATAGTMEALITPMFDLSGRGTSAANVSLWIYRDTISALGDSISVFINTTNSIAGATWLGAVARATSIALPNTVATNGWYQYTFAYPASFNTTTNYILINGNSQGGRSIYVDDVNYDTYPPACTGTPAVDTIQNSISVICGGSGSATLKLTHPIIGFSGITYQWQSASSSLGPWAPLTGATNAPTANTGTLTSTTFFMCVISCSGHGSTNSVIDSIIVSGNTPPNVTVTPSSATVCSGTPTTLTAIGASTYSWTPATNLSATTGSIVIASPVSTGGGGGGTQVTYIVTGTDAAGCMDTAHVVFRVNAAPNATITSSIPNDTICAGTSITLSVPNAGGFGGASPYHWSNGDTLRTNVVSPITNTTYSVTVTRGTCSTTDSVKVVVNAGTPPVVTVTPTTAVYCVGTPVMIVASATGATSFSWTPANGLSSTNNDTVYAAPAGGGGGGGGATVYTVVVSNGTCSASATSTITRSNPPTGNITTNLSAGDTICTGGTVILTGPAAGGGGGGGYTYAWSNGTSTRRDTILNITTGGLYTLAVSNAAGCTKHDTVNIVVVPGTQPVLVLTPNGAASYCTNTSGLTLSASGATNYSWSPATGLSTTTGSSVVATPTAGPPTVYTVTGTDASGKCKATATVTVTTSNPPAKAAITANPNDSVCAGTQVILRPGGFGGGGNTYQWNDGKTTRSDTTNINSSGWYTVAVTNTAGCTTNDSIMMTLLPGVNANFGYTISGRTVTFTDSTVGATSWSWTFGDGNSSINQNPITTYGSSKDTFYVTLVATGSGSSGCNTGSITKQIILGTVGVNNLSSNSFNMNLYPNPTTDAAYLNFKLDAVSADLKVMNTVGQTVLAKTIYPKSNAVFNEKISIENLSAGVYLIQVNASKGSASVKLIKE